MLKPTDTVSELCGGPRTAPRHSPADPCLAPVNTAWEKWEGGVSTSEMFWLTPGLCLFLLSIRPDRRQESGCRSHCTPLGSTSPGLELKTWLLNPP